MAIPLQDFIFNTWIPFLISFALLYGVLEGVKIFDRRISLLIAFLATLAFSASPFFEIFSQFFIKYSAFFILSIFLVLFVGGGLIFGKRKISSIYEETKELKEIEKEIDNCKKELEKAEEEGDTKKVEELKKKLKELEKKKEKLLKK